MPSRYPPEFRRKVLDLIAARDCTKPGGTHPAADDQVTCPAPSFAAPGPGSMATQAGSGDRNRPRYLPDAAFFVFLDCRFSLMPFCGGFLLPLLPLLSLVPIVLLPSTVTVVPAS